MFEELSDSIFRMGKILSWPRGLDMSTPYG
jgi:hypothetical protein